MSRVLTTIVLIVLSTPRIGFAQTAVLEQGQRVRVAYRCKLVHNQVTECRDSRSPRRSTGYAQSVDDDTLRIRAESSDAELAIPRSSIAQVWMVEGKKGNFWPGFGLGLIAGGVIGGVIGSTQEFCIIWSGCGQSAAGIGVLIGAPAGALLGGVVGLLIRSDRWEEVPLDRVHVGVVPQPDGLGIGLSIAF